ncbi:MarR family transcriptional regulator [Microbacterium sp. LRZ72]|uniref:MarR family winged helix-turn-helix transcriptional regulator n=1 Tax=Microbacterium sp. LRZ72 TaxID=2942481 RepID=UPI0029BC5FB5|nr:MarR family transcriptional regulator [Microbacterium sp. LRZ72]MDX2376824.1 MarR family transcriptional regulator [Microbacterium sp. LRZ72]
MSVDELEDTRSEAVRALEGEFGELIARLRRVIHDSAQRLSPGMLPGAYKTFTTIVRRGPITPSALAETLLIDKGQVSRTVRDLEGLGLVERSPDPSDGRSTLIAATEHGVAALSEARADKRGGLMESLREWSTDDIRTLTRLLHALRSGEPPEA